MNDYNFRNNCPEKDNEDHIAETSFKEKAFWLMLFLILLVLVGIFIQNFHIMQYEKKIAFSNTSSSAGIENPENWEESDENTLGSADVESPKSWEKSGENALDSSDVESPKGWEKSGENVLDSSDVESPKDWEESDENAIDDFDIEGLENDATSRGIEDSMERTFVTKPYEVTTAATTKSNVAVSEGVLREATTKSNADVSDGVIREATTREEDVEQLIENSYGEKIAIYAREFYKEYQGNVNYGFDSKLRKKAYWLIPEDDGTFTVDCVGLVNLVVHNATGFSLPDEGEWLGFVVPEKITKRIYETAHVLEPFKLQDDIYGVHPGDILTVDGMVDGIYHEVIYIGNGEILDITNDGLEIKWVGEYKYDKRAQLVID